MEKQISISEIFGPTIQGEGSLIGIPTVFVRTGSCDYRCKWCDTLYAVLPKYKNEWRKMTANEIMEKIINITKGKSILITLSGGNPAIQPLEELITLGHQKGYKFAVETQGTVSPAWLSKLDHVTISPKPPSSGMNTDYNKLSKCILTAEGNVDGKVGCLEIILKIVVFDDKDFIYAQEIHSRFPHLPVYLSAGSEINTKNLENLIKEKYNWLLEKVKEKQWYDVVVLPQLHTLLWGGVRGV